MAFVLLLYVEATGAPQGTDNKSEVASIAYEKVLDHLRRGEYCKARMVVEHALSIEPCNPDLHEALGAICYALGENDRAIEAFTQAIRQAPRRAPLYRYRGCSLARKKDLVHALEDFNKAIKIDPEYAASYSSRGSVYRYQGQYARARSDFEAAVKHGWENPDLYLLAQILATCPDPSVRDGRRAIESAQTICERTEYNDPDYLNIFAASYAEAGQWDKANHWVKQALALSEKRTDDRGTSGDLRMCIEMCHELYRLHEPYRTMPPEYLGGKPLKSAVEALLYGAAKTIYRDHKGAIVDLKKSIELNPSLLSAHYYLATELTQLGSASDAIDHYNKILESNPKNFMALAWRGESYCKLGQFRKALEDAKSSLVINPRHFRGRLIHAWALVGLGDINRASEELDLLELEWPDDPSVHFVRGESYLRQSKFEDAVSEFSKAIWRLDPSPLAYAERAVALTALGRDKEAKKDLDECICLNPTLRSQTEARMKAMKEKRRNRHDHR